MSDEADNPAVVALARDLVCAAASVCLAMDERRVIITARPCQDTCAHMTLSFDGEQLDACVDLRSLEHQPCRRLALHECVRDLLSTVAPEAEWPYLN